MRYSILFYLLFSAFLSAQQADLQKLTGLYLGQKPPGTTAEVFAPGIVSKQGYQVKLFFTPDGSEAIYAEREPVQNKSYFVWIRMIDGVWTEPVVIPFSTEYINNEPCLSPDGKRLIFVSNRPESPGGEAGQMPDIWMSERTGSGWGEPKRLGPGVNTQDIEVQPYCGSDDKLYFLRQVGKARQMLCVKLPGDEPAEEVRLGVDLFQSQVSGSCVSPDDRIRILHSRKEGGFGGWDLYALFKDESGNWGQLIRLGESVNTAGNEADAAFSPDGKFLFFSRDGDIYWVSAEVIEKTKKSL